MAYGYPGDATGDTNSSLGIGDDQNQLYATADHQSVALTKEGRFERFGVWGKHTGQSFTEDGKTYFDDDTAPTTFHYKGEERHNSPGLIDVFEPTHPPDKGGGASRVSVSARQSEPTLYTPHTQEEWDQIYGVSDVPRETPKPEDDPTPPFEQFRKRFPEDNDVKDDDILTGMRKHMDPDNIIAPDKFATLARSQNGWKAIQNEVDKGMNGLQRLRKLFPEASDKSNDDFLLPIYNKMGSIGQLDSRVTSFSDFKEQMSPQSGPINAMWQLWKGATRESSAVLHAESAKAYNLPNNAKSFSDTIYQLMDQFNPEDKPGTQVKKLAQAADEWLDKNTGIEDYWRGFVGWMSGRAQAQMRQMNVDEIRAQHAGGIAGKVGRVGGSAVTGMGVGMITSLIPGMPLKSAAIFAGAYESLSRGGAAVQAHHDNALMEYISGFGMGQVYRYMWNSPNGRLLSGFTTWLADAGEDTISKWLKGEPVDYQEAGIRSGIDIVAGVLAGRHQGDLARPAAFASGTIEEGPNKGQSVKIQTQSELYYTLDHSVGPDEPVSTEQISTPGPLHEFTAKDILGETKESEQLPWYQGVFGHRQHEGSFSPSSLLEETKRLPSSGTPSQMRAASESLGSRLVIREELSNALEARRNGDNKKATEHLDRALSSMPLKEQKAVAKQVIKFAHDAAKNNGETRVDKAAKKKAPIPTPKSVPEPARNQTPEVTKATEIINSHFYGLGNRGERGAIGGGGKPGDKPAIKYRGKIYTGAHHENAWKRAGEPKKDFEYGWFTDTGGFKEDEYGPQVVKAFEEDPPPFYIGEYLPKTSIRPHGPEAFERAANRYTPNRRGESGFITLPWQKEIGDWFDEHWRGTFKPQARGPEPQAMWVASKRATSEAQQATEAIPRQIARALEIDKVIRGGEKSSRRSAVFDHFSEPQMKEIISSAAEGDVHTGNEKADWILNKFHKTGYQALEQAEKGAGFNYEEIPDYLYQAVKHDAKAEEGRLETFWNKYRTENPRWTQHRQFPTPRQLFEAGFTLQTLNPERLFQMRLASSMQAIRKVVTLRDAAKLGGAVAKAGLTAEQKKAFEAYESIRAPNGEQYFITPKAGKVIANVWKPAPQNVFTPIWKVAAGVKGVGARFMLAWSGAHAIHMIPTYLGHAFVRVERALLTGPKRIAAFNEALIDVAKNPFTGFRILDAWRGGKTELTPDEIQDLADLKQMGLDLGMSEERMLEFSEKLREMFPQWRNSFGVNAGKLLDAAYAVGSSQQLMRMQFGTFIPILKVAGAIQAREALYRARPELLKPENEVARRTAIAKLGDEIDLRFGEINYGNVYWPRIYKDIGQALLLSMGWTMNTIHFVGGAAHDMMSNAAHAGDLIKKLSGKNVDHTFLTDRLLWTLNYTAGVMTLNALRQLAFTGQPPQGKDYVFPRIGKNPDGTWMRARPIEFTTEFGIPGISEGILGHHIEQAGGYHPIGMGIGAGTMALNKLNPFVSNFIHAVQNQNYFGQEVRDPLDNGWKQTQDSLSYVFGNMLTPIPFQAATQNTGQPFDWTVAVKSMMGLPKSPGWTGRSPMENKIADTYHRDYPKHITAESKARSDAHQALAAAIRDKDEKARVQAVSKLRTMGVPDSSITTTIKHAHQLPGDVNKYYFKEIGKKFPEDQVKLFQAMSPEEQKTYQPLLGKAARAQLQPPAAAQR